MNAAYACRLTEENYGAIASEKPGFDLEELKAWLEEHGPGFFVRDEDRKAFDCRYMMDVIFYQCYDFEGEFNPNAVFHRLVRI